MDETLTKNQAGRDALAKWQKNLHQNVYSYDPDFIHTLHYWFKSDFQKINKPCEAFGKRISSELEPLVALNHDLLNRPRLERYNAIGEHIEKVIHHPSYTLAGDIIYGSQLLSHLTNPGGLLECLSLFFLSSEAGEAGHNCPIACAAGIIRVFTKTPDFPRKAFYLKKLIAPSYQLNFTGAQFLTEIQGGSDVGQNAAYAKKENDHWRIYGEKWFCSNANADLIFVTARFDDNTSGTKGLGLFLIPAIWENTQNHYTFRRLKEKLGTQTMATAEMDFHGAYGLAMGKPEDGFQLTMQNVLHISRLFNSFCVLGMARRAYTIASTYATYRKAFSKEIITYPLIIENLARIKVENSAMTAAVFAIAHLQDQYDLGKKVDKDTPLLLRLLVNIHKYLTAKWSVIHIHHALDVLAGNGAIETFSSLPRLLRDCIVCENWEGTHNILHMQILKDIQKYSIDQIYMTYMRKEVKNLDKQSPYKKMISVEMDKLEEAMLQFRRLDNEIQSLQIPHLVDRMGFLFCALRLSFEALDELKSPKLDYLDYFWMLHIDKTKLTQNKHYLTLITRVVSTLTY